MKTLRLAALAALLPAAALAAPANQLYWPSSNTGISVCAYFDHAGQDWNGGSNRYSGHRGTDIALPVGNAALAAAPGTVVTRTDGCPYGGLGSTCGGGFGNHVALHHAGDTTFYAHLSAGSGIAAQGATVGCGDRLGGTGSSGNSSGPHLHFEVRVGSSPGSPYSGTADDPYAGPVGGPTSYWASQGGGYSRACGVGTTSPAAAVGCGNKPPRGWLEAADCAGIAGWAQDENAPTTAIEVHLYFDGPAGGGATGLPVRAGNHRADLCGPLGSCEHAYALRAPRSLFDGQPHAVHAYGIDPGGGANTLLQGSPKTLTCAELPRAGVRRHVADQAAFTAWAFSQFMDVQPVSEAQLDAWKDAEPFPAAPELVRADGATAVYLLDRGLKRHVPGTAVAAAWRLDLTKVKVLPAAQVAELQEGPPLRARPELVQGSRPAVYLVDDALPPASVRATAPAPVTDAEVREGQAVPRALRPPAVRPPPQSGPGALEAPDAERTALGGCASAPGLPLAAVALLWARRRRKR